MRSIRTRHKNIKAEPGNKFRDRNDNNVPPKQVFAVHIKKNEIQQTSTRQNT